MHIKIEMTFGELYCLVESLFKRRLRHSKHPAYLSLILLSSTSNSCTTLWLSWRIAIVDSSFIAQRLTLNTWEHTQSLLGHTSQSSVE